MTDVATVVKVIPRAEGELADVPVMPWKVMKLESLPKLNLPVELVKLYPEVAP